MATPQLRWTPLLSVQHVTFYDPSNISNSFTPQLNPNISTNQPHNLRTYTETVNGTSTILGDREFPPNELTLKWDQIDISDLLQLRLMTNVSPVVFVDNNDNGFLGILVITENDQLANKTSNVWMCQCQFLVLAPYNGLNTPIASIYGPSISCSGIPSAGYIPIDTTLYFWSSVFTPWGESVPSGGVSYTTAGLNEMIQLTWTPSTSIYHKKTRIYWNSTNDVLTATMLTEVLAGFSGAFNVYGPYVNYSNVNPALYGTSFTGFWAGGYFISQND